MTEMMKALVYSGPGIPIGDDLDKRVYLKETEVSMSKIKPHQIRGEVLGVSVCGSTEGLVTGKFPNTPNGIIPGHEMYIRVVETGKKVEGIKKGQLLAVESHYRGRGIFQRRDDGVIGFKGQKLWGNHYARPMDGAWAEYVTINADCAHPIEESLRKDFHPSLLEAAGNDYLIAKYIKENGLMDRRIAVVGCGQHGLYTQMFLRQMGCQDVSAVEAKSTRVEFAKGFGQANAYFNPREDDFFNDVDDHTQGERFDWVIDAAGGSQNTLDTCKLLLAKEGTLVLFGLYNEKDTPQLTNSETGESFNVNDIIFGQLSFSIELYGHNRSVKGLTGREGIWGELIKLVTDKREVRTKMMELVTQPIQSIDHLIEDMTHPTTKGVRKLAYTAFPKKK